MSKKFTLRVDDPDGLIPALERATNFGTQMDKIIYDNLTDMFNRAKEGWTPVDTGELRQSVSINPLVGEIGYTKEYAPHVEFGHRTVSGGYVPGQHFLDQNLARQEPWFLADLRDALDEVFR